MCQQNIINKQINRHGHLGKQVLEQRDDIKMLRQRNMAMEASNVNIFFFRFEGFQIEDIMRIFQECA